MEDTQRTWVEKYTEKVDKCEALCVSSGEKLDVRLAGPQEGSTVDPCGIAQGSLNLLLDLDVCVFDRFGCLEEFTGHF